MIGLVTKSQLCDALRFWDELEVRFSCIGDVPSRCQHLRAPFFRLPWCISCESIPDALQVN